MRSGESLTFKISFASSDFNIERILSGWEHTDEVIIIDDLSTGKIENVNNNAKLIQESILSNLDDTLSVHYNFHAINMFFY